ncbi:MAG: hypothetical protein MUO68_17980, partial [Desulfobacteraceae bacterium]|nr:hypothetical protein [Desulfobacteraceae bacterium]
DSRIFDVALAADGAMIDIIQHYSWLISVVLHRTIWELYLAIIIGSNPQAFIKLAGLFLLLRNRYAKEIQNV